MYKKLTGKEVSLLPRASLALGAKMDTISNQTKYILTGKEVSLVPLASPALMAEMDSM